MARHRDQPADPRAAHLHDACGRRGARAPPLLHPRDGLLHHRLGRRLCRARHPDRRSRRALPRPDPEARGAGRDSHRDGCRLLSRRAQDPRLVGSGPRAGAALGARPPRRRRGHRCRGEHRHGTSRPRPAARRRVRERVGRRGRGAPRGRGVLRDRRPAKRRGHRRRGPAADQLRERRRRCRCSRAQRSRPCGPLVTRPDDEFSADRRSAPRPRRCRPAPDHHPTCSTALASSPSWPLEHEAVEPSRSSTSSTVSSRQASSS